MTTSWASNDMYYNYAIPTFIESGFNINEREIVIELDETTDGNPYVIDCNFVLHNHDVTIRGRGINKTKVIFNKTINLNVDDSVLNFKGSFGNEISVKIMDLCIESNVNLSDLTNGSSDLTTMSTHVIKCYHVKSFVMQNVSINVKNIITTCLDIRRGYNIAIRNCIFANYNRRCAGGNIWLRGDTENVSIKHCVFYKYGADEIIGIWGSNNFQGENEIPQEILPVNEIHKKNIHITHNRIFCQDENGGPNTNAIIPEGEETWNGLTERFITFFTNQDDNKVKVNEHTAVQRDIPCSYIINDIQFSNNEIYINAPITFLFTIAFDKHTTHKGVTIKDNIIRYGDWLLTGNNSSNNKVLVDFNICYDTIYNYSQIPGDYNLTNDEPFFITGNTITCGCNVRNMEMGNPVDYHICLEFNGTVTIFNKNRILYTRGTYSEDESNYANKGIELFKASSKGGTVIFNNNYCEGLKLLLRAIGNEQNKISFIRLQGKGNYLYGNPRLIYNKVTESHVSLIGNEFISDYQLFLVSEFANTGTVIFTGNRVYREMSRVQSYTQPKCQIFYTSKTDATTNISTLKFVCCDNVFENVLYSASTYYDFQMVSAITAIHKDNIFADYAE